MTLSPQLHTIKAYCETQHDADNASEDALSFYQIQGVLTAICCSPQDIEPELWMPLILPGLPMDKEPEPQVVSFLEALLAVADNNGEQLAAEKFVLPSECVFDDSLSAEQPLSQWAQGFLMAHQAMDEIWQGALATLDQTREETEQELYSAVAIVAATADMKGALEMARDDNNNDFEALLPKLAEYLLQVVNNYFQIGQALYLEHNTEKVETFTREEPKVGRNDPCVCGSGKKYKKCCGK